MTPDPKRVLLQAPAYLASLYPLQNCEQVYKLIPDPVLGKGESFTKEKQFSPFTIAGTYVGTVVGAGFASGQEVLQFFVAFGVWGLLGVAVVTGLFVFFGLSVMELGHRLKAKSHLPVVRAVGGPWISTIIDVITTFFLFGALVAMAAGSGAIFVEQFRLPAVWGSFFLIAITLVTVLLGISRVFESISFVAPILLLSVLTLSLITIFTNPGAFVANLSWSDTTLAAIPYWPVAAVLYASYNLVLTIAVLAPLGAMCAPRNLRLGAVLGGVGLGLGVLAIATAVLTLAPQVAHMEVPMIAIAGLISPRFRSAYSVVLLAEVYSTAVASLYGFASRLTEPDSRTYRWLAIGASILALVLAQVGFSTIVGTLYPAVGFAGVLLLVALAYGYLKALFLEAFLPTPATKPGPDSITASQDEKDKQPDPAGS